MIEDRQKIFDVIAEMIDNPDECGIYPTTRAYDDLEEYCDGIRKQAEKQIKELRAKLKVATEACWEEK